MLIRTAPHHFHRLDDFKGRLTNSKLFIFFNLADVNSSSLSPPSAYSYRQAPIFHCYSHHHQHYSSQPNSLKIQKVNKTPIPINSFDQKKPNPPYILRFEPCVAHRLLCMRRRNFATILPQGPRAVRYGLLLKSIVLLFPDFSPKAFTNRPFFLFFTSPHTLHQFVLYIPILPSSYCHNA